MWNVISVVPATPSFDRFGSSCPGACTGANTRRRSDVDDAHANTATRHTALIMLPQT